LRTEYGSTVPINVPDDIRDSYAITQQYPSKRRIQHLERSVSKAFAIVNARYGRWNNLFRYFKDQCGIDLKHDNVLTLEWTQRMQDDVNQIKRIVNRANRHGRFVWHKDKLYDLGDDDLPLSLMDKLTPERKEYWEARRWLYSFQQTQSAKRWRQSRKRMRRGKRVVAKAGPHWDATWKKSRELKARKERKMGNLGKSGKKEEEEKKEENPMESDRSVSQREVIQVYFKRARGVERMIDLEGVKLRELPEDLMIDIDFDVTKVGDVDTVWQTEASLADQAATINVINQELMKAMILKSCNEIERHEGHSFMVDNGSGEEPYYPGDYVKMTLKLPGSNSPSVNASTSLPSHSQWTSSSGARCCASWASSLSS